MGGTLSLPPPGRGDGLWRETLRRNLRLPRRPERGIHHRARNDDAEASAERLHDLRPPGTGRVQRPKPSWKRSEMLGPSPPFCFVSGVDAPFVFDHDWKVI